MKRAFRSGRLTVTLWFVMAMVLALQGQFAGATQGLLAAERLAGLHALCLTGESDHAPGSQHAPHEQCCTAACFAAAHAAVAPVAHVAAWRDEPASMRLAAPVPDVPAWKPRPHARGSRAPPVLA